MSLLLDVLTFWSNNTTLNGALPVGASGTGKVWPGIQADGTSLPYATLNEISTIPAWTVAKWSVDTSTLQISIWHTNLASADALADTVQGQFDRAIIGSGYLVALRTNRQAIADSGGAYHIMLEYMIALNKLTTN